MPNFDAPAFRLQFPFFSHQPSLIYLDSAATTLKPISLINATNEFYCGAGSVHRSQYDYQQSERYEQARHLVAKLVNAESERSVVWTSGTTASINMVAQGIAHLLKADDEIIISEADHHANYVTWCEIAKKHALKIHILPIDDDWLISASSLLPLLNKKTKLVAFNYVSNVTGTTQPLPELIALVRERSNALILVDCAQAVAHMRINCKLLDADFYAFSAHKLYGPNGLGVLMGKQASLQQLQPWQYGGKMVNRVSEKKITFSPIPHLFEAGTPNIAGVIGFGEVLKWLQCLDMQEAEKYAVSLAEQTKKRLSTYQGIQLYNSPQLSTIVCFTFDGINVFDLASLLTEQNIALRVGEHCAQPYLKRLGQQATLRLSFAPYNDSTEITAFFSALDNSIALLRED